MGTHSGPSRVTEGGQTVISWRFFLPEFTETSLAAALENNTQIGTD